MLIDRSVSQLMFLGCQVKEIEMVRSCSKNGGDERCVQGFSGKPEKGDHLKDQDVDGKIVLK